MRIPFFRSITLVFLVGVSLAYTSCHTIKQSSQSNHSKEKSDSVGSNTSSQKDVFDSTTLTPATNAKVAVASPCDQLGHLKPVSITNQIGNSSVSVRTVHDTLYVDCHCDATINRLRKESAQKDSSIAMLKARYITDSVASVQTVIETKTPWYAYLVIGIQAGVILLLFILLIIAKYANRIK